MSKASSFVFGFLFALLGAVVGGQVTKFPAAAGGASYDQDLNTTDPVTFADVTIATTLAAPTDIDSSTSNIGSLPAGQYFFKVVAVTATDGLSLPSAEESATIDIADDNAGHVALSWAPVPWATSYRVYIGTATDQQTEYFTASSSPLDIFDLEGTAGTSPVANTATIDLTAFATDPASTTWITPTLLPLADDGPSFGMEFTRWSKGYFSDRLNVGEVGQAIIETTPGGIIFRPPQATADALVNSSPQTLWLGQYWDGVSSQDIDTIAYVEVTDDSPLRWKWKLTAPLYGGDTIALDQDGILIFDQGVTELVPQAFTGLPAAPREGMMAWVNDSSTATWGATIAGGGANKVLAVYNGANWTVAGK